MIDRQSVGPVRAVPEPADRQAVWRITRDDGRSMDIVHLDPLSPDPHDSSTWSVPDWAVHLVALLSGVLLILAYAMMTRY